MKHEDPAISLASTPLASTTTPRLYAVKSRRSLGKRILTLVVVVLSYAAMSL